VIGQVHLLQSRTEGAIVWFEKAPSANPRANAHTPGSRPRMPSKAIWQRDAQAVIRLHQLSESKPED
jgi:hypothetical protein